MSERFLFFNSATGDPRKYQAQDFAEYFGSVLSTGLLHTDKIPGMKVSVAAGTLNTVVTSGKAIMKGHLYENTTPLTLNHSIPEPTLDRIDRIVLRLNLQNSERNILLHVKEGLSTTNPVAPTLQRDQFIHEISLAQIRVRKNTVQLLPSDITDERLDENLCGLVSSLLSIPTDLLQSLLLQRTNEINTVSADFEAELTNMIISYQNEWQTWFDSMQTEGFVTQPNFNAHVALGATTAQKGHVQLSTSTTSTSTVLAATPSAVKTAMDRANAAFQQANDGKEKVANAIVAQGVPASPSDTFDALANKIGQISGVRFARGETSSSAEIVEVRGLSFKPAIVIVKVQTVNPGIGLSVYTDKPQLINSSYGISVRVRTAQNSESGVFTIREDGFYVNTLYAGVKSWIAIESLI